MRVCQIIGPVVDVQDTLTSGSKPDQGLSFLTALIFVAICATSFFFNVLGQPVDGHELLIGDRQTGKSTIAIDAFINPTQFSPAGDLVDLNVGGVVVLPEGFGKSVAADVSVSSGGDVLDGDRQPLLVSNLWRGVLQQTLAALLHAVCPSCWTLGLGHRGGCLLGLRLRVPRASGG